ncbi:Endonuclease [Lysobacter dokdonensis DS-58]|uniref:Endonuclease n=1 Tax=Lysobacter dokdonensis DS-58 TaxID=1300345 RepID=A0A0A2WYU9_9GAMM|nr:DNA-formamidopyrimidine glycosylase family protein [Lysobacter dokdonensis]KGQ18144.1 Endonuclease [Lysobacter dokdonensis DS-58]
MPEGPSIVILREEAASFAGRKVLRVEGNARLIDVDRMRNQPVRAVCSWGKHFLIAFPTFALRVHFMLFGSYRIDERKPNANVRLSLGFAKGRELNFYACSLKYIEGPLDETYDWSADVMADAWNPRAARKKLSAQPDALVADALLDQSVFSGVGNIIKNEVLHRIRVHPESTVGALPSRKLGEMIKQAREYSFDFLEWKKAYVLRKHWQVHAKKTCPRDSTPLSYRKHLGRAGRRAFWCATCQTLYE